MCIKNKACSKDILDDLFTLYEDKLYENTDLNKILAKKILKVESNFYNTLTIEQKEKYDTICTLKNSNYAETGRNIFKYTFCLASSFQNKIHNNIYYS